MKIIYDSLKTDIKMVQNQQKKIVNKMKYSVYTC